MMAENESHTKCNAAIAQLIQFRNSHCYFTHKTPQKTKQTDQKRSAGFVVTRLSINAEQPTAR